MVWQLFVTFLKIGFVAFGGGYAVIPMIQYEVEAHGWLEAERFRQVVAMAGMSPGPISTNAATLVGYDSAGMLGGIAATLGMVLPSLAVIVLLSAVFFRFQGSKWMKSSLYGLRPIIAGMIAYAALHFGFLSGQEAFTWMTVSTLAICGGCLVLLVRYKLHPIAVIAAAGVAGIVIYT
ncbi:chromate transporter [Paenibacillus lycopersici]|uniref:Chromate transporter n=1 Tax=Paenibacillus lycopersici TaxID=2704462 RepID=A0A6C0G0Y2_9BACL|nr:chromate transporter [Paenibacillus lycopersici]QHT61044.1 chromate transporter [Paenibacillus lycopersici]